jgi:hypothetical protein
MAKYYNGTDGSLSVDGVVIGKVRNWSFTGSVDALGTTTLADSAATYRSGRQSYSGSCDVLYYADGQGAVVSKPLLSDVLRTGAVAPSQKRRLVLAASARKLEFDAVITNVQIGASAGEVMQASISFVVTGQLVDASMGG